MPEENKSNNEIKDVENNILSAYSVSPAHNFAADKKTINRNLYFVDFLRALGLIKDAAKVLDIGCGTGWVVEMFRRKGHEVYGGDILPIKIMRERFPKGKYLYFDIFEPPQDAQKYDFIYIRSLGPLDKHPDWRDLALFPWIGDHLNGGGVLFRA